jgi:DNA replication initiation complex subunit (GINS family)
MDFQEQIEEQQVFSAIWELESQVNNGGFAQYFTSADGHTANFAAAALQRIGANRCADIVTRALRSVTGSLLPDDQSSREQIVNGLDEHAQEVLESLDQEFFAYPDNLTELLFEYVRSNPQVFGGIRAE